MITYFIQSGGFVKIGRTKNLQSRIDQLCVGLPTKPIVLKSADMPETVAHKIAGDISTRANGEWFEATPKLLEWIDAIEPTAKKHAVFTLEKRPYRKSGGAVKAAPKPRNFSDNGVVSVPLGSRKKELRTMAKRDGTTETNLARTFILYCLDQIKEGKIKFSGPTIQPSADES